MESTTDTKCVLCQKYFSQTVLSAHQRLHSEDKIHPCDLCGLVFTTKERLTKHTNSKSNYEKCKKRIVIGKTFRCDVCEKVFYSSGNLAQHKKTHVGEKSYDQHKRIHTCEKLSSSCNLYQKYFTTSSNLSIYNKTKVYLKMRESQKTDPTFIDCDETIKVETVKEESHEEEGVKDPICIDQDTEHINVCKGIKEVGSVEDLCNNSFPASSSLARHKRVHTREKPYNCDLCEKTFSCSSNLAHHIRIHTGGKKYQCSLCEKVFIYKYQLVLHKRIHLGFNPYHCDICKKSFSQKSNLSQHINTNTHRKRMQCLDLDSSSTVKTFVDCGETVKKEDIKEDLKEEENTDDPLSVQGNSDNTVAEVKEEVIDGDFLYVQEINNSGDGENNTVVEDIDIMENKIETEF